MEDILASIRKILSEDDGEAAGGGGAQRGEERLGLLRRQDGGRLVKDQDPRVAVKRLQDLHPLPLAHRKGARPRVGMDSEAEIARQLPDPRPRRAAPPPR